MKTKTKTQFNKNARPGKIQQRYSISELDVACLFRLRNSASPSFYSSISESLFCFSESYTQDQITGSKIADLQKSNQMCQQDKTNKE